MSKTKTYLVENEDANICNWGCYWLVRASNAKEAIDKAYKEANNAYVKYNYYDDKLSDDEYRKRLRKASDFTGIKKKLLTATCIDDYEDVVRIK